MSEKQYQIRIKSPCGARVSQMASVAGGKFCKDCDKTVVDFTQSPREKIREHLLQSKTKVCGFLQRSQLSPTTCNSITTKILAATILSSTLFHCQSPPPPISSPAATSIPDTAPSQPESPSTTTPQDTVSSIKATSKVIDDYILVGDIDIELIQNEGDNPQTDTSESNTLYKGEPFEKDGTASKSKKEFTSSANE